MRTTRELYSWRRDWAREPEVGRQEDPRGTKREQPAWGGRRAGKAQDPRSQGREVSRTREK